jgi:hypothetical protein
VAAEAVREAVVDVVAAGGAAEAAPPTYRGGRTMRMKQVAAIVALGFLTALVPSVTADEGAPRAFDSYEAAAKALIDAAANNDDAALKSIFGAGSQDLVSDGSDPLVQVERKGFAQAAVEKLVFNQLEGGAVELVVGDEGWPFPVLLVQSDGKWVFDAEEGREEILARRIGRDELEAIGIMEVYLDAQAEYASEDRDGDEVREYAQKILSSDGQKDGLYWPADPEKGEELSPLGPAVISIQEAVQDYQPSGKVPFNGYYWKVLKAQGPAAPGGAYDYVINGNMIAGFALLGVPARYGNTGIMTFIVSHHGKMYEKDLGENSLEAAKAITTFDPSDGWTEVTDEDE